MQTSDVRYEFEHNHSEKRTYIENNNTVHIHIGEIIQL